MAIIIIEGCDCTGKSTLATLLSKKLGYEIVKGSSFEISKLGAYGMYHYMADLLKRDNIIIDRFYLSNYVYGNLYGYPTMSSVDFMFLSNLTEGAENAMMIYVTADNEMIKERMKNRGDDDIKVEEVDGILEMYRKGLSSHLTSQHRVLTIDTTVSHVSEHIEFIENISKFLDSREVDKNYY